MKSSNRAAFARLFLLFLLLSLVLCLPGCYPVAGGRDYCQLTRDDPDLPVERSKEVPVMRIGSLPHPFGPIPVNYGDPTDLGTHSIRASSFRAIRLGEQSGGIIYTTRAGFIDLAHTRNAADLAWMCYQRVRPALAESRPRVLLAGAEPTLFLLHLDYPPGWAGLSEAGREALVDLVAVRLAVRMGYVISTWHEVLTSFGYHGVALIPEKQSAFAYDDQPSHWAGAVAAGRAIRWMQADPGLGYNAAMTAALAAVLVESGALKAAGTRQAVDLARGRWWDIEGGSLRQVHLGMAGETFVPMLLPLPEETVSAAGDRGAGPQENTGSPQKPMAWCVPAITVGPAWISGLGVLPSVRVAIDPRVSFASDMYDIVGHAGPWIDLDQDGSLLKKHLEALFRPIP